MLEKVKLKTVITKLKKISKIGFTSSRTDILKKLGFLGSR